MVGKIVRVILASALALSVAGAVPAAAKEGDVIKTGACSGASDWKLKLSPENGRIEVEYEVDSNKVGQTWRVRIYQNGNKIFGGSRVTKAPSGSFSVRVLANDTAGTDAFKGRATNPGSGELCVGRASF
jgi:hypothetical protein